MTAAIGLAVLLGGWEALVRLGGVDPLLLPAPTRVAEALDLQADEAAPFSPAARMSTRSCSDRRSDR